MGKRFTETGKWADPWFRKLPPQLKCLWMYLCDCCDAAGVIDFDEEMASLQIGYSITYQDFSKLDGRVEKLPSGKWRILKFLGFQYGTVDAKCPAHKPVIKAIQSHGLQYPIANLSDTLSDRVQDKEKEKEEESETDKSGIGVQRKGSKKQPDEEWLGELGKDPTYVGIDVPIEFGKMRRWCEQKNKSPTRARFINWLNNADRPMIPNGHKAPGLFKFEMP